MKNIIDLGGLNMQQVKEVTVGFTGHFTSSFICYLLLHFILSQPWNLLLKIYVLYILEYISMFYICLSSKLNYFINETIFNLLQKSNHKPNMIILKVRSYLWLQNKYHITISSLIRI